MSGERPPSHLLPHPHARIHTGPLVGQDGREQPVIITGNHQCDVRGKFWGGERGRGVERGEPIDRQKE